MFLVVGQGLDPGVGGVEKLKVRKGKSGRDCAQDKRIVSGRSGGLPCSGGNGKERDAGFEKRKGLGVNCRGIRGECQKFEGISHDKLPDFFGQDSVKEASFSLLQEIVDDGGSRAEAQKRMAQFRRRPVDLPEMSSFRMLDEIQTKDELFCRLSDGFRRRHSGIRAILALQNVALEKVDKPLCRSSGSRSTEERKSTCPLHDSLERTRGGGREGHSR